MLAASISTFSFAQFRSKQDVYDYLEGKTFMYYSFCASFHNGVISLDWEDNYKCKMNVIGVEGNIAYLEGRFSVGSIYGRITYNLKMKLNKTKDEFSLVGGPEDGTYKLAPQTDTPRPNSFDDKVYDMREVDKSADFPNGGETAVPITFRL